MLYLPILRQFKTSRTKLKLILLKSLLLFQVALVIKAIKAKVAREVKEVEETKEALVEVEVDIVVLRDIVAIYLDKVVPLNNLGRIRTTYILTIARIVIRPKTTYL